MVSSESNTNEQSTRVDLESFLKLQFYTLMGQMNKENKDVFTDDETINNLNDLLNNAGSLHTRKSISLSGYSRSLYGIDITGQRLQIDPYIGHNSARIPPGLYFSFTHKEDSITKKNAKFDIPKKDEPVSIYSMGLVIFLTEEEREEAISEYGKGDPMYTAHLYLSGLARIPNGGYSTVRIISKMNHNYYMVVNKSVCKIPNLPLNYIDMKMNDPSFDFSEDEVATHDILVHRTDIIQNAHRKEGIEGCEKFIKVPHNMYTDKDGVIFTKTGMLLFRSEEQAKEFIEKYDGQYDKFLEDRILDNTSEKLKEEIETIRQAYGEMNKNVGSLAIQTLTSTVVGVGIEKVIQSIAQKMKEPETVNDGFNYTPSRYSSFQFKYLGEAAKKTPKIVTVLKGLGKLVLFIGAVAVVTVGVNMIVMKVREMMINRKIKKAKARVSAELRSNTTGVDGTTVTYQDEENRFTKCLKKVWGGLKKFGRSIKNFFDPGSAYVVQPT